MRLLAILCPWKAREEGKIKPAATDTLHTQIYCVALNIKRHYTRLHGIANRIKSAQLLVGANKKRFLR